MRPHSLLLLVAALVPIGLFASAAEPEPQRENRPAAPARPWLGVFLGDATDGGVQLVAVVPGGPAEQAGLKPGDIVLRLDERPVTDRDSADAAVERLEPGERVHVRIVRDGSLEDRILEVGARDLDWVVPPSAPGPRHPWSPGGPGQQVLGLRWIAIPDDLRIAWGAPRGAGVLVARIEAGGPAAKAGVRVGDIVLRANGASVRDADDVPYLSSAAAIRLEILRRGAAEPIQIQIPPGAVAPPAPPAAPPARAEETERRALQREVERLRQEVRRLEAELERARKPE